MKLDAWTLFNLPAEARQMISAFASPDHESSFVKNIPIGALDQAKPVRQIIERLTGRSTYVKFRGPRHDRIGATCLKRDAWTFAVYLK